MKFAKTPIKDLIIIEATHISDERGSFTKTFEKDVFGGNMLEFDVQESFESVSKKDTLRGLHFQQYRPQAKIVRASKGEIWDVAVDIRKESETFGKWHAEILSEENHKQMYVPEGFAHGFLVLSDEAVVSYLCKGKYFSEFDTGIIWNDETLNIDWPIKNRDDLIISERDSSFEKSNNALKHGKTLVQDAEENCERACIVTGANGFIGGWLVNELVDSGYFVYCIVRENAQHLDRICDLQNTKIIYCNMAEIKNLSYLLNFSEEEQKKMATFFCLAWSGTAGNDRANVDMQLSNMKATCDAVYTAKQLGCERFVYAGSIIETENIYNVKANYKMKRTSTYGSAKLAADYMARAIAYDIGIEYISGIISNAYGEYETPRRLILSTINQIIKKEQLAFSPSTQMYDFIYVKDAVQALMAISEKGIDGKSYYIGSQKPKPLKEFLGEIKESIGGEIDMGIGKLSYQGVDFDYKNAFDIFEVEKDTGFVPKTSFEDGIKICYQWALQNNI